MEIGAVSSILNGMQEGADLTGGLTALSQAQAALSAQLLVEMFALMAATEIHEAVALALIQNAMGIGQNVDMLA